MSYGAEVKLDTRVFFAVVVGSCIGQGFQL